MDTDIMELQGVGPALLERLHHTLGGSTGMNQALKEEDVGALASVDGISVRKAVDLIWQYHGRKELELARTDRARKIQDGIYELMRSFAPTAWTRDRLYLYRPTEDRAIIRERVEEVMAAKKEMSAHTTEELGELGKMLKHHAHPTKPRPIFDTSLLVLAESEEIYSEWDKKRLDRWVTFTTPGNASELNEYDLVIYLYEESSLDLSGLENVVTVHSGARDCEVVPHPTIAFFEANRNILENMERIRHFTGMNTGAAGKALQLLDGVRQVEMDPEELEDVVLSVKAELEPILEERIKGLSINGDEILSLLGDHMPPAIGEIFRDVLGLARSKLRERTGLDLQVFGSTYPLEIDHEVLERARRGLRATAAVEAFAKRVKAARELERLKGQVQKEVEDIFELDMRYALGTFALAYDLNTPTIDGEGIEFTDGIHLDHALAPDAQPVSYSVGVRKDASDRVVMLTGANSGGKTTLLETLSQLVLMAYMGLPVRAQSARVGKLDALYFFSQKRNLDAGAFESFLRGFMPLALRREGDGKDGDEKRLILADELEAMTELEAASKIISVFCDMVRETDSTAVIVTHMAREVSKYTSVRIDGIEALGLDDEHRLLVDRTPRQGHLARSTPELIVRRLKETSPPREAELYQRILDRF